MRYLILGNGVAGTYAAKALREVDAQGEITIISGEAYPFYSRPRLPELLAGEVTPEKIIVFAAKWYTANNIKLQLKETVAELSPLTHTVKTNLATYTYDRLLLALGSQPQLPPINGLTGEGVFSLRTIEDALIIQKLGKSYKKATLIGAGLLGLEAAYGLIKLGLEVTVIEYAAYLLARQMDKQGAELLQKRLEKLGYKFKINAVSQSVAGPLGQKTLSLKDAAPLLSDFIVVSAGIKSNIELPQAAGIICNRGVVVNAKMQTNFADVYAAGDVAEFNGRVYGIWPAGQEQGIAAGRNMAGKEAIYGGTLPSTTLKVAGIDLTSFGKIADFTTEVTEKQKVDPEKLTYAKIFLQQDKIVGGIFLGEPELSRRLQLLAKKDASVRGYEDKLLTGELST